MTDREQSIFLLSLFNGISYIEKRFLMDQESVNQIVGQLKFNQISFVKKVKQMILQDSASLKLSELSEKYGIPLNVVSDILKENEGEIFVQKSFEAKNYFQEVPQPILKEQEKQERNENQNQDQKQNDNTIKTENNIFNNLNLELPDVRSENGQIKNENPKVNDKIIGLVKKYVVVPNRSESNQRDQIDKSESSESMISLQTKKNPSSTKSKRKKEKAKNNQISEKAQRLKLHFEQSVNGDFTCKQCQKTFTSQHMASLKSKQILYTHLHKKHSKKFSCDQCSESFSGKKECKRHVESVHAQ